MLTARIDSGEDKSYERYYMIAGINEETLSQAKNIFKAYQEKGVILNENFYDNEEES